MLDGWISRQGIGRIFIRFLSHQGIGERDLEYML